jgi:aminoglycoside 6'-N-acetyltransferase I
MLFSWACFLLGRRDLCLGDGQAQAAAAHYIVARRCRAPDCRLRTAHGTIARMEFAVRQMGANDRAIWAEMRIALWPDETLQAHTAMIDELLGDEDIWALIAEATNGGAIGFAEIAMRKYANGCDTRPVAFFEGVWIKPQFRRLGIGTRLIAHAEAFLAARGFRELGSDTEINNEASQAAHLAWGFSETERVVYFRKLLRPPNRQR